MCACSNELNKDEDLPTATSIILSIYQLFLFTQNFSGKLFKLITTQLFNSLKAPTTNESPSISSLPSRISSRSNL